MVRTEDQAGRGEDLMRNILIEIGLAAALATSPVCLAGQPAAPGHPPGDSGTRIINADVEGPVLQPGLWEYRRTISSDGAKPKEDVARHCTDPTAEFRHKRAELAHRSCQFEPMFLKEHRYTSSWVCITEKGPIRFQDAMTVTDAAHYVDTLESRSNGTTTHQTITAERLSSCALPDAKSEGTPIKTQAGGDQR